MVGRNVFMGYLDEEAKTREAIDGQGRLHSGDVGKVDADGFLYITGRIKGSRICVIGLRLRNVLRLQ